jgi:putative FmdB family regulatory protein
MPIYEYHCLDCGHEFDLLQKFSDPPVTTCPSCSGTVKKLISRSAFHLKGDGWYVTDYARKSGKNGSSSSSAKDSDTSKSSDTADTSSAPKDSATADTSTNKDTAKAAGASTAAA